MTQPIPHQRIDDVLSRAVSDGDLPMIVAMAADSHGPFYAGAFGNRTIGIDAPVGLDTTFRLHSMTKAVTAVAAMQLVEQGKITLDEPLGGRFPALGQLQVLEPGAARRLRPARTPVTLKHLLTHTAGFSYDIWNAATLAYQKATGFPGPFSGRLEVLNQPLAFEPGTRWHYSISIDWVGRIVEALSGCDLETYFSRHVFEPLGIHDTGFRQTDAQRSRRVTMHRRQPDGTIAPFVLDRPEETEYFIGGGGLFGTVPDYLKFTHALLTGGGPILQASTVALMRQNHIGDLDVEPMRSQMPQLSADCEFWPGMVKKWGLSFLINTEQTPEGRGAHAMAWAGLSNLYFWIDPAKDVTVVFASQMLPYFDARAVKVLQNFEYEVYDSRR